MKIVYTSDGNDYDRLEMSVFSVRKFLGDSVEIVLLTDSDKKPAVKVKIANPRIAMDSVGFTHKGWNRKWPFATNYRLAIPLMEEFNDDSRVLYLDTDTLMRTSLPEGLFNMNLRNYEVIGSGDMNTTSSRNGDIMYSEIRPDAVEELANRMWINNLTEGITYVNAGVLMFNLERIRENGIDWYKKRLQWLLISKQHGKLSMLDQDFVNVFMETGPILNKQFNYFGGDYGTNCHIQHFCSGRKHKMTEVARRMGYGR